ncbi:hypothetical protein BaRGS_00027312 [Batillaria attramentaria]|uniref:Uncharacterized protein n=1 Tax=Batillaria attramentaria TaxID=370345 RepID=A0ABD0K2E5_9CAEN
MTATRPYQDSLSALPSPSHIVTSLAEGDWDSLSTWLSTLMADVSPVAHRGPGNIEKYCTVSQDPLLWNRHFSGLISLLCFPGTSSPIGFDRRVL